MSDKFVAEKDRIPISVWLSPSKLRLNFCMICRSNLGFRVEGNPSKIIVGVDASVPQGENYRPLKFPIKVYCDGRSQIWGPCPALWIIQGIIEE